MNSKLLIEGSYASVKASIKRLQASLDTVINDSSLPDSIREAVRMWAEECKGFNLKHFDDREPQKLKGKVSNISYLTKQFEALLKDDVWSALTSEPLGFSAAEYTSELEDLNIDITNISKFDGCELGNDYEQSDWAVLIITPVGYVLRDEKADIGLYPSIEDLKSGLEKLNWGIGPDYEYGPG